VSAIGWLTFPALQRLRILETTFVFDRFSLLSLARLGREWGEAEWTSRDLWDRA
jgi:hypothetical protein